LRQPGNALIQGSKKRQVERIQDSWLELGRGIYKVVGELDVIDSIVQRQVVRETVLPQGRDSRS
jgi:hypothetical protein